MAIIDVIKYEGSNTIFVWKHPAEDFNYGSQLIVHQSQEAIFFLNGEALDSFGPGRHTLETQNIPLLTKKVFGKVTGDVTPFHAEVYFVNLTEQMAINWGTDSKVNFLDPTNNDYAFPLGASGEMSLRVEDPRKLVIKIVGTENILPQDTLSKYFRAPIMTKVKSFLPRVLRSKKISVFELDEYLDEFSTELRQMLTTEMEDYGVVLQKFWITRIVKPEEDPTYQKILENRGKRVTAAEEAKIAQEVDFVGIATEEHRKRVESDVKKYDQDQLGYDYSQKRGFDVMEGMAKNEGSGSGFATAAMGVGMGLGVGGAVGSSIGNIASSTLGASFTPPAGGQASGISGQESGSNTAAVSPVVMAGVGDAVGNAEPPTFCADCGGKLSKNAAFCSDCGVAVKATDSCKKCGYAFEGQKPFCHICGTKRGE